MFQLTKEEAQSLRSQNAILETSSASSPASSRKGKHSKFLPYAFTEHGAIMAASVLNSPQAVQVSVFVVRAFVQLREMLSNHKQLAAKLEQLEAKLQNHDEQIVAIVEAIRELMEPPPEPRRKPIGFASEAESKRKDRN